MQRQVLRTVKEAFENNNELRGMLGVTPEIRYYFLLLSLQKQAFEEVSKLGEFAITEKEKEKRIKEFYGNFGNRLKATIKKAGGTYVSHEKRAQGYLVEWEVGGQLVKSIIRDDMRIVSAGFCLSGDDKRHSMGSLINLAKLFQEEDPLYIVRN